MRRCSGRNDRNESGVKLSGEHDDPPRIRIMRHQDRTSLSVTNRRLLSPTRSSSISFSESTRGDEDVAAGVFPDAGFFDHRLGRLRAPLVRTLRTDALLAVLAGVGRLAFRARREFGLIAHEVSESTRSRLDSGRVRTDFVQSALAVAGTHTIRAYPTRLRRSRVGYAVKGSSLGAPSKRGAAFSVRRTCSAPSSVPHVASLQSAARADLNHEVSRVASVHRASASLPLQLAIRSRKAALASFDLLLPQPNQRVDTAISLHNL